MDISVEKLENAYLTLKSTGSCKEFLDEAGERNAFYYSLGHLNSMSVVMGVILPAILQRPL